jgi:hypothetical protein
MDRDWRRVGPVVRCHASGRSEAFPSLASAVSKLEEGVIRSLALGRLGRLTGYGGSVGDGDAFVFVDELGLVIPPWRVSAEFYGLPRKAPRRDWHHHWYLRWSHYSPERDFRNGAMYGIHRRKWHRSRGKRLRTAEYRDYLTFHLDEDAWDAGVRARPRYSVCKYYEDDGGLSGWGDRCWKRHRLTQYK